MYILWFLQVVFPYFVKNKKIEKKKEGKVLKEKSKDLEKIIYPKEKRNKTWKCASPNAATFYFVTDDYGRMSINAIIHDELNCLILTCHVSILLCRIVNKD